MITLGGALDVHERDVEQVLRREQTRCSLPPMRYSNEGECPILHEADIARLSSNVCFWG